MPSLSVIVPVYNAAPFLAEAVESALGNGFPDLEVLIVDDGSTDGSTEVALRLVEAFPDRARLLFHPDRGNHGVSASRNLALEAAGGEFVAFLDADDRYLPGHLALSVRILQDEPAAALTYGRVRLFHAPDAPQVEHSRPAEWGSGPGYGWIESAFARLLEGNFIPLATVVARKSSLLRAGGFDLGLSFAYEDYLLWTKIASREPIFYTNACTAEYRVHPGSYSSGYVREIWASVEETEYLIRLWAQLSDQGQECRTLLERAEVAAGSRIAYRVLGALRRGDLTQLRREFSCLWRIPHPHRLLGVPGYWYRAHRRANEVRAAERIQPQ